MNLSIFQFLLVDEIAHTPYISYSVPSSGDLVTICNFISKKILGVLDAVQRAHGSCGFASLFCFLCSWRGAVRGCVIGADCWSCVLHATPGSEDSSGFTCVAPLYAVPSFTRPEFDRSVPGFVGIRYVIKGSASVYFHLLERRLHNKCGLSS